MFIRILYGLLVFALSYSSFSWAQAPEAGGDETGANVSYEGGVHIGKLLPNQVPGLTEITGVGGLRGGYKVGDMVFLEGGAIMGKGNNAEITSIQAGVRMDVPIENIVGMVFLGPSLTYYKGAGQSSKFYGGGHIGGGVQALIGGNVWFRSDMTFTVNPGTSLYIGFGFAFRFSGGGGA